MATRRPSVDAATAAVPGFLSLVSELHQLAISIHDGHPGLGSGISRLSSALVAAVDDLRGQATDDDRDDVLVQTCVRVGQDLLIRLDRVQSALESGGPDGDLQAAWPTAAIDALGDRIRDLCGQASFPISLRPRKTERIPPRERVTQESGSKEQKESLPAGADGDRPTALSREAPEAGANSVQDSMRKRQVKPSFSPPSEILEGFILDSLAYKSMRDREEEVTEAHDKTLEWIFNHENDGSFGHSFTTWLTTDELGSTYWISGKPGSGKSTLMRFLFDNSSTTTCLESWAGDLRALKAGFFFWTSGSKEQRSQTGLLRYLLHQLLSADRAMMPKTFPDLWRKLQTITTKERINMSLEWEELELARAFRAFVDAAVAHSKICLFVDGLDEFEGDHRGMVQFFKSLGEGVNDGKVKMCLSSRPWAVFEESYHSSVPNLKLQDLTYEDMYRYTADRLTRDSKIGGHLERNTAFERAIVRETVRRADGVFLWVRLAVTKMLRDFQADRDISQLQGIIERLPTELEELFEMFLFVDQGAAEIADTANIFQLIAAREVVASFVNDGSANSLTVWEVVCAIGEDDESLALSSSDVQQASDEEVRRRCDTTCARIDKRFAGLLGVFERYRRENKRDAKVDEEDASSNPARSVAEHKVTYVHRTIRDWLMEADGVRERLVSKSPEGFDPHLRLLRSGVLALKLPLEKPWRRRWLNDWWPQISLCMTHARHIQRDPDHLQRPLMAALDNTIGWYWIPSVGDPSDHWAKHAFGSYEVRMRAPPLDEPFLYLATKFGLANYVREELEARVLEDSLGTTGDLSIESQSEADELGEAEARRQASDEDPELGSSSIKEEQEEDEAEEGGNTERNKGAPLLSYATEFLCSRKKTIFPLSSPSLVAYLLAHPTRHNPGPNSPYTDFDTRVETTPWLSLLRHLRDAHRRGWISHVDVDPQGTARWTEIVRLFIEGGADVDAVVQADRWDPEISASGVLELLEKEFCAAEVRELSRLASNLRGGRAAK